MKNYTMMRYSMRVEKAARQILDKAVKEKEKGMRGMILRLVKPLVPAPAAMRLRLRRQTSHPPPRPYHPQPMLQLVPARWWTIPALPLASPLWLRWPRWLPSSPAPWAVFIVVSSLIHSKLGPEYLEIMGDVVV